MRELISSVMEQTKSALGIPPEDRSYDPYLWDFIAERLLENRRWARGHFLLGNPVECADAHLPEIAFQGIPDMIHAALSIANLYFQRVQAGDAWSPKDDFETVRLIAKALGKPWWVELKMKEPWWETPDGIPSGDPDYEMIRQIAGRVRDAGNYKDTAQAGGYANLTRRVAQEEDSNFCSVWCRQLALLRVGQLYCSPAVQWTFLPVESQSATVSYLKTREKIRWMSAFPSGSEEVPYEQDLVLSFRKDLGIGAPRMDVLVKCGGELERSKLSQRDKKTLKKYTQKRVYLPLRVRKSSSLSDTELKEQVAQVCLYLVQTGLVTLNAEQTLGEFLWSYCEARVDICLKKKLKNKDPKVSDAVFEQVRDDIKLDYFLRNYQIPEDYRAFAKYVKITLEGKLKTEKRKGAYSRMTAEDTLTTRTNVWTNQGSLAQSNTELTVENAAQEVGVPLSTAYDLINKGKVRAVRRGGQILLVSEGQEDLRKWQANRQRIESDKEHAQLLVTYTKISFDSAMRQLRRLRKQDLGEKEIAEKIGRACGLLPETAGEE